MSIGVLTPSPFHPKPSAVAALTPPLTLSQTESFIGLSTSQPKTEALSSNLSANLQPCCKCAPQNHRFCDSKRCPCHRAKRPCPIAQTFRAVASTPSQRNQLTQTQLWMLPMRTRGSLSLEVSPFSLIALPRNINRIQKPWINTTGLTRLM